MSNPSEAKLRQASREAEPPTVGPGDAEWPSGPAERVALVAGARPVAADLREELRQRLRFLAAGPSLAFGIWLLVTLITDSRAIFAAPGRYCAGRPGVPVALALCLVESAVVWRLSRRSIPSMRRLRALEAVIFLAQLGYFAWLFWDDMRQRGPPLRELWGLASYATSLPYAMLMVFYTLVPNTGRRCAGSVACLGVAGLAFSGLSFATWAGAGTELVLFLVNQALWLGIAGSAVVYTAHRVEVLRTEAAEARRLGPYRLVRLLGSGGMGQVYLAEHLLLRRPSAIKLLRSERVGDPEHLARFEREVRATSTLTHPNTVQIFDYGHTEDGTFYYVMEYLPGLTLEQLVKQHGPLAAPRAVHFLRQLCGALHEAHVIRLIHRDIKPGNVMVCERGGVRDVAKLLDFGLVLRQGCTPDEAPAAETGPQDAKLTSAGTIMGTPAYMAPEQAAGADGLDARCDIYSLGALAYFLLTGRPPFAGPSVFKMIAALRDETPEPPTRYRPDVPADLEAVVLRCLSKRPEERFGNVTELDAALSQCRDAGRWSAATAADWWEREVGRGAELTAGSGVTQG